MPLRGEKDAGSKPGMTVRVALLKNPAFIA